MKEFPDELPEEDNANFKGPFLASVVKWFKANGLRAGAAFILASLIYFQFHRTAFRTEEMNVEVKFDIPVDSTLQYEAVPAFVKVKFKGAAADLNSLHFEKPVATIKYSALKKMQAGEDRIVDIRDFISKPDAVRVVGANPSSVTVHPDTQVEVDLGLDRPEIEGEPYHGHVKSVVLMTNSVTVIGSKAVLDKLTAQGEKLKVESVNVEKRAGSIRRDIKIFKPDIPGIVSLATNTVRAMVEIAPDNQVTTISNAVVKVLLTPGGRLPARYELTPPTVTIEVTAWSGYSMNSILESTGAYIEIPDVAVGDSTVETNLQVQVTSPWNIEGKEIKLTPNEINLVIHPEELPAKTPAEAEEAQFGQEAPADAPDEEPDAE